MLLVQLARRKNGAGDGGGGGWMGTNAIQSSYETTGSSATAWEAVEEAMELHTAAHLGAAGEVRLVVHTYIQREIMRQAASFG